MTEPVRGRDLRMQRIRAGLKQEQIAKALGVTQSLISALETETLGEYPSPDFASRYVVAISELVAA